MKKILVLLFIALPFFAHSQLEAYGKYTTGESVESIIDYNASKKITEKISLTFFGLVRQKWSQALIGIKYAPSDSFNLSASAGIEHGTDSPRFSASMWIGKGRTSLLLLGELGKGKDNYLYKSNLFYKYTERFTLGITAWRYHGVGPNFRFAVPKLMSTLWAMPAYDFEADKSRLMVGVLVDM
ncbi:MAG TPA: hypothetical protein VK498_15995 [Ferruginibacter sp.]|nr:hypothetical protein [Ferruginibacter sp.]